MRDNETRSAMGPSSEPGEAHPRRADEAQGLGGAGTEGKPGPPEGGTESQIPEDITDPHTSPEDLRAAAERLARGRLPETDDDNGHRPPA